MYRALVNMACVHAYVVNLYACRAFVHISYVCGVFVCMHVHYIVSWRLYVYVVRSCVCNYTAMAEIIRPMHFCEKSSQH